MITKKSGTTKWVFGFNLSRTQTEEQVIRPFTNWEPFMCGEWPVEPADVEHIRINETEETASQILARTKLKRVREKIMSHFVGSERALYIDQWYVTHAGKDVTRELIKGFNLSKKTSKTFASKESVFIVHGQDPKSLKELKIMLQRFGLDPIILIERAGGGSRTIVEKLEKYSDVGYVFVILTPDDFGGTIESLTAILSKPDRLDYEDVFDMNLAEKRARQNVILEFGYFMGLLGRDKVCCLYKGDVELPSDMQGIAYIRFEDSVNEAKSMILKELKAAGYELKTNK